MKNFLKKLFCGAVEHKVYTPQVETDTQHKKIMKALYELDLHNPEKNTDFMNLLPYVHRYLDVVHFINTYGHVSRVYAKYLASAPLSEYKKEKVEEALINCNQTNLLYYMRDAGYKWTAKGKALIKDVHPKSYKHLFEED